MEARKDHHSTASIVLAVFIGAFALVFGFVYGSFMISPPPKGAGGFNAVIPLIVLGVQTLCLFVYVPLASLSIILAFRDGPSKQTTFITGACATFMLTFILGIVAVSVL